ncbi:siderophore-interacting protein [Arthrobacter sp. H5]|uniref:siderophore-interacting protein n=1 Tax=Arthrobacter sp. H5 TaxID=1267973 RepID=UPI0004852E32|nr:siderophore-interacting protein [Arthrobacter sp. H5]
MSVATPRPPKPQTVLTVDRTEWLSPTMVRIVASAPSLGPFEASTFTDKYVKILFAKPELGLVPPYDLAALKQQLQPADLLVTRTYTVRSVDPETGQLSIDFVVHGDEGIAGPWAAAAKAGDTLAVTGPGGAYAPDESAGWHLFAGDESALPAIASALERLPGNARGAVYLEVEAETDRQSLRTPAGVVVHWLFRAGQPASAGTLADAIHKAPWPEGRVQVFAHGERESMKLLRDIFFTQRGLDRSQVSLSGYWARGRTEDRFQAEKREPIGQILN